MPARRPPWSARLSTLPALIAAALVLLTAWPATAQRGGYRWDPNKRKLAAINALGRAVELNQEAARRLTPAATEEDIQRALNLIETAYGQATIAGTEVLAIIQENKTFKDPWLQRLSDRIFKEAKPHTLVAADFLRNWLRGPRDTSPPIEPALDRIRKAVTAQTEIMNGLNL